MLKSSSVIVCVFSDFQQMLNGEWKWEHEDNVGLSGIFIMNLKTSSMTLPAGFSFCISFPNEFWELCAVVITTRCQLGNLYANGIGPGLISLSIPQDLVTMGMPNSASSNWDFFSLSFSNFLSNRTRAHGDIIPGAEEKKVEVWRRRCNLTGQVQLNFELVWSNELVEAASRQPHDAEAQVDKGGFSGQGCLTAAHLDPILLTLRCTVDFLVVSGDTKPQIFCRKHPPTLHELKVTMRTSLWA